MLLATLFLNFAVSLSGPGQCVVDTLFEVCEAASFSAGLFPCVGLDGQPLTFIWVQIECLMSIIWVKGCKREGMGIMPRLNLEISESQMDSLRVLEKRTGVSSMKDLVNNALTLLDWAVQETAKGNEIASVNEEQSAYRVMVMPVLNHVAQESRRLGEASELRVLTPA
jgi:hypothetical protein